MNKCKNFEELINLYIDDMLGSLEVEALLEHLDECESCSALYKDLKNTRNALKSMKIEYPEELTAKILDSFEKNKAVQVVQYQAPKRLYSYIGLASCACIAITLSIATISNPLQNSSSNLPINTENVQPIIRSADDGVAMASFQPESLDINDGKIPVDLSDSYAFVFEFQGSNIVNPPTNSHVLYSDDKVLYLIVDNNLPTIETFITDLKKNDYIEFTPNYSDYIISETSSKALFVLFSS